MKNKNRRTISTAEEIGLVSQVNSVCPLCGKALFYTKKGKSYKHYEIAHIYPLNPTREELTILQNTERLNDDVNHVDNLIPLCNGCHSKFDKPRTVEEYKELVGQKKQIIASTENLKLQHEYKLQNDIAKVIGSLNAADFIPTNIDATLEAKAIDSKINAEMHSLTREKIRRNVSNYFVDVRKNFQRLDQEAPGSAELISAQVRAYYLAQKKQGFAQQKIFTNTVAWLHSKSSAETVESVEIVASFFVQNCEVFE